MIRATGFRLPEPPRPRADSARRGPTAFASPNTGFSDPFKGGFRAPRRIRSSWTGLVFDPFGVGLTADERRAFLNRVRKRRARKGYR